MKFTKEQFEHLLRLTKERCTGHRGDCLIRDRCPFYDDQLLTVLDFWEDTNSRVREVAKEVLREIIFEELT